MKCPSCGSNTKVINSRHNKSKIHNSISKETTDNLNSIAKTWVWRYRKCVGCERTYQSVEFKLSRLNELLTGNNLRYEQEIKINLQADNLVILRSRLEQCEINLAKVIKERDKAVEYNNFYMQQQMANSHALDVLVEEVALLRKVLKQ